MSALAWATALMVVAGFFVWLAMTRRPWESSRAGRAGVNTVLIVWVIGIAAILFVVIAFIWFLRTDVLS